MSIDGSYVRVKAMLIAPNPSGAAHALTLNATTAENPAGYHRLIGGSVELGETHAQAIVREVAEELGARTRSSSSTQVDSTPSQPVMTSR